jgi:hypothetical protein
MEDKIISEFIRKPRFSGDKIEKMRWVGHVAPTGEKRGLYRVFGEETLRKEITCETQA